MATKKNTAETVSCAAVVASYEQSARAIVVLSNSGITARLVAKYRPGCPIVCVIGKSNPTDKNIKNEKYFLVYIYQSPAKDHVRSYWNFPPYMSPPFFFGKKIVFSFFPIFRKKSQVFFQ